MKLNLGCGDFPLEGFVNIDLEDFPGVDLKADICDLLYEDCSVDFIYAGHVLEHIENWREALQEWKRVLKPGGEIIITIPDTVKAISLYSMDQKNVSDKLLNDIVYAKVDGICYHREIWWQARLVEKMIEAGFIKINNVPHCEYVPADVPWQSSIKGVKP